MSHDTDGAVSHLVRIIESETALSGEYLRDGEWHDDGSVVEYLVDPSLGQEISAAEGERLAIDLGALPTDLASGFRTYFAWAGLELPDPIPTVGLATEGDWTVRYKLADDDGPLDFLAIHPSLPSIHGAVHHDGSVELFDTYLDHSSHDPSLGETLADGERRMNENNDRVTAELTRKGLI